MADERRSARRARISGVRVTYESASGDRVEADALDLARGGLFVRTTKPLAVGKRIALEIQVIGQPGPWSALGRVVWSRDAGDSDHPPGMGVKLIDIDDAVVASIDRLVDTREPTEPGVGVPSNPPQLEAPVRLRDPSIPIDLVARKKDGASERPPAPAAANAAPAASPAEAKRGGCGWMVVLGVLAMVAGIAGYVLFEGLFRSPPQVAPIPSPPGPAAVRAPGGSALSPSMPAYEPPAAPPPVTTSAGGTSAPSPGTSTPTKKPAAAPPAAPPARAPGGTPPKRTDTNPY
jgi:uncharacterized protein (TIGR02266 family)